MKIKIISCKVFQPEIEYLQVSAGVSADIEFIELGEHARPEMLRMKLQNRIDNAVGYDAVVLCYGLCGGSTEGLRAVHSPLVVFRNHDCGGILLGSKKKYEELFREMPSTPFASAGFTRYGDYFRDNGGPVAGDSFRHLVEVYGEDNAEYIWETMHPRLDGELRPVYYIHTVRDEESMKKCREKAAAEGRKVIEVQGSAELLRRAVAGEWDDESFLILAPGEKVRQTGDWQEIIRAEKIE